MEVGISQRWALVIVFRHGLSCVVQSVNIIILACFSYCCVVVIVLTEIGSLSIKVVEEMSLRFANCIKKLLCDIFFVFLHFKMNTNE